MNFPQNIIKTLGGVSFFSSLTGMELSKVGEYGIEKSFSKGEIIINEGEESSFLFIILDGRVKVTKDNNGLESIITILEKGEVVGEMSIFDNTPRSATITTCEDTQVLILKQNDTLTLIHKMPEIAIAMLKIMAQRNRKTSAALSLL